MVENAVSVLGETTVQGRTQFLKELAESGLKPGSRELSAVKGALSAAKYGFVIKRWHGARVSRGALRYVGVCVLPEEEFARLSRCAAGPSIPPRVLDNFLPCDKGVELCP